ncbi:heliorhodopsin HeR, partial [Candidatus Bathyarchaeota archaeon]|nr:heliorhodopsin HeR [Candidatus Bathyarchaeota archaeon]
DFSIFSRDQQDNPDDITSGGRALSGFVRPYARKTAGEPVSMSFDLATKAISTVVKQVAELRIGPMVAMFLFISALAHFLIAFPKNKGYNENLKKGMNPYRWYEYAFSSSIMIVLISTFVGVWDLWSLVMIFVLNAMMIMFGYFMEVVNQKTEKTSWSAFIVGCISGGVPWVVLFAYFIAAVMSTGTNPPAFVYSIFFIYFAVFNVFALNMVLQYKGVGKWKDYLYGERVYIILSFIAKTILAWLVFIGIFAPF